METKYLSDGRKVAVVGQLNNQETIVQEIFVSEAGDEIPSGERFVVKSLHDAPVESYKAKEEKRLEKRLAELKVAIENYQHKERHHYAQLKGYAEMLKSVSKFAELVPEAELDNFTGFLTGTIEYLVVHGYQLSAPVRLIDRVFKFETGYFNHSRSFESLKLLSVAGRSGGDLEYWLHEYSDGGGGYTTVKPFTTFDDAVDYIKKLAIEKIEKKKLSEKEFDLCDELGITLPQEAVNAYKEYRRESLQKSISHQSSEMEKVKQRLETFQSELASLSA